MATAFSSSSCIAGSRPFSRSFTSFGPRRWFVGIELDFRSYWRWKSRNRGGRPQIDTDLRALIRQMSLENPLWGAPRIHGELLKLGFQVAQSTVAKYMVNRRGRPSGQ